MDFAKGTAVGFALAMTLLITLLAVEFRDMAGIYADFGGGELPLLTRATISAMWLIGAPVGGAAACVALYMIRPRSLVPYVLVALLLAGAAVVTWYGPRLPIFKLAGNITGD